MVELRFPIWELEGFLYFATQSESPKLPRLIHARQFIVEIAHARKRYGVRLRRGLLVKIAS